MKRLCLKALLIGLSMNLSALLVVNEPSLVVYEAVAENAHIEDVIGYGTAVTVTQENEE